MEDSLNFEWLDNPFIDALYYYIILKLVVPALEKLVGNVLVINFLSRIPIPFFLNFQYVGAKKFDKYDGINTYDDAFGLPLPVIQRALFEVFTVARKYFMINENVQSFLFQNSFKLTTEFNYSDYFKSCEAQLVKVVSYRQVSGASDQQVTELRASYLEQISYVTEVLNSLQNKLALGSLGYLSMICYGASIGGVYHTRIYNDCLDIAFKLVFENSVFQFLETEVLNKQFVNVVSLLIPTPLSNKFDTTINVWFKTNSSLGSRDFKALKNHCYLTIIDLTKKGEI
jgi:hypothetical protein